MEGDLPLEVVVAQRLSHPGLVRTLAHATAGPPAGAEPPDPRQSLERACSMPSDSALFSNIAPPTPRLADRGSRDGPDPAGSPNEPYEAALGVAMYAAGAGRGADAAVPARTLGRVSHATSAWHDAPSGGPVRRCVSHGLLPVSAGMDPAPTPKGSKDGSGGAGARMQDACGIAQRDDSVGAMDGGAPVPPLAFRSAPGETWLLLELCDRGSLQVRGHATLCRVLS